MEENFTIYVCKQCGRAMRATEKPNYCYFDRMDSIENISDEDAVKMGLFSLSKGVSAIMDNKNVWIEFPADVRFSIFKGNSFPSAIIETLFSGLSLDDFQDNIMRRVINGK